MSICNSCNQKIHFGRWRGRWYPIDPTPHLEGRWARIQGRWRKQVGVRYETALINHTPLHPLHDCPARRVVGEKES